MYYYKSIVTLYMKQCTKSLIVILIIYSVNLLREVYIEIIWCYLLIFFSDYLLKIILLVYASVKNILIDLKVQNFKVLYQFSTALGKFNVKLTFNGRINNRFSKVHNKGVSADPTVRTGLPRGPRLRRCRPCRGFCCRSLLALCVKLRVRWNTCVGYKRFLALLRVNLRVGWNTF